MNSFNDFVDVAGTFNSWNGSEEMLETEEGSGIYSIIISTLTVGDTIQYKFRINGNWDTSEFWGQPDNNRIYTVEAVGNLVEHWYDDMDYSVFENDISIYNWQWDQIENCQPMKLMF